MQNGHPRKQDEVEDIAGGDNGQEIAERYICFLTTAREYAVTDIRTIARGAELVLISTKSISRTSIFSVDRETSPESRGP